MDEFLITKGYKLYVHENQPYKVFEKEILGLYLDIEQYVNNDVFTYLIAIKFEHKSFNMYDSIRLSSQKMTEIELKEKLTHIEDAFQLFYC